MLFSFRFIACSLDGTVLPARFTDMEVTIDSSRPAVSFRLNLTQRPKPADNPAGGWFVLDEKESVLWINRFMDARVSQLEDCESIPKDKDTMAYKVTFYHQDSRTVSASGDLPPRWERFVKLINILYPVLGDWEFFWPAGLI